MRPDFLHNAIEERLLGVSFTGIFDNDLMRTPGPALESTLRNLHQEAVDTNAVWATKLGINPSKAITTVWSIPAVESTPATPTTSSAECGSTRRTRFASSWWMLGYLSRTA